MRGGGEVGTMSRGDWLLWLVAANIVMNAITMVAVFYGVRQVLLTRRHRDVRIAELEKKCSDLEEVHSYLRDQVAVLSRNSTIEFDPALMRRRRREDHP
jgi:hypothetical protein